MTRSKALTLPPTQNRCESIKAQAKKYIFFSGRGVFSLDPTFNG